MSQFLRLALSQSAQKSNTKRGYRGRTTFEKRGDNQYRDVFIKKAGLEPSATMLAASSFYNYIHNSMNLNIHMGSRKSLYSQSPQRIFAIKLDGTTSHSFRNSSSKQFFKINFPCFPFDPLLCTLILLPRFLQYFWSLFSLNIHFRISIIAEKIFYV